MTDFPAVDYVENAARTQGEMKIAFDALAAGAREFPGGSAETTLTIASGSVTPGIGAAGIFSIDTQAAAAADDLSNIVQTNVRDGGQLLIRCANAARVVTVKHNAGGAGTIVLAGSADLVLNSTSKWLWLKRTSTSWQEIARFPASDFLSVKDFGGIGNDVFDNSTAKGLLHTAAGVNGAGWYSGPGFNVNEFATPYHVDVKDARGVRIQVGRASAPATSPEPVAWFSKTFATARTPNATEWDVGALYADADKQSGDAYGAAFTAYARYSGGTGDLVGGHLRARGNVAGSSIFGGWSYAHWAAGTVGTGRTIGHEFNVRNDVGDPGWATEAAAGATSAVTVKVADGTYPSTHGIRVAYGGSGNLKFWSGIQIGQDSIMPTDGSGNGEAIRIAGGSASGTRYMGIRMESGHFHAGLVTSGATIGSNAALWLGDAHRIVWGTTVSAGFWLEGDNTTNILKFTGGSFDMASATAELLIGGTKILDARVTGWGQPTGTPTRTTFATSTVTLPQLAERVYALLQDLGVGAVAGKHGLIAV